MNTRKSTRRRKRKRIDSDDDYDDFNDNDSKEQQDEPVVETKKEITTRGKRKAKKQEPNISFTSKQQLPFKNPKWLEKKKSRKRSNWKTLKQILQLENYSALQPNIPTCKL